MLVALLGKKGSGKTTTAEYMEKEYKFIDRPLSKPIKDSAKIMFDLSDQQLYTEKKEELDKRWNTTPRKIFQLIGTEIARSIDKNVWIKHFISWYSKHKNQNIVVSDCRFQDQIDAIKNLGGIVIKITRETLKNNDTHITETGIDNIKGFDYTIENNCTIKDLHAKIDDFFSVCS